MSILKLHEVADDVVETDVLVVGAGAAGLLAGIKADDMNVDVAICSKGLFRKSGATVMSTGGMEVAIGHGDPTDNPDVHFRDTVVGGEYINDQRLVDVLTREAVERLVDLERMGIVFERQEDGRLFQFAPGGAHARVVILGDLAGSHYMVALNREVMRRNIRVFEEVMITNLLTTNGAISGAVGLDIKKGELIAFKTKAVVLATGGAGQIYRYTSNPVQNTGDGRAMAYRVGAELIDMEMVQFHPTGLAYPPERRGTLVTEAVRMIGAYLLNNKGERFMKRYDPQRMELAKRDVVARAICTEVREGRGTEWGGVYLDASHIPEDVIERRLGVTRRKILFLTGIDLAKEPIHVYPTCHYFMGGVRAEPDCSTKVPGLFVAGEEMGGVHGANRLGGNSITTLIVFGWRAGISAAKYAKSVDYKPLDPSEVAKERDRIFGFLGRKDYIHPSKVRRELQEVMWDNVGIVRTEESMKKALGVIERMRVQDLPKVGVPDGSRRYRMDWVEAIEFENMLTVAEMVTRAAMFRKESRGAHVRDDYPQKDNKNWLVHTVIKKVDGEMKVWSEPVELIKLKPPDV
ncbi:MAG: fumarate reductase/succinate dehydrogenase flavoprotein subunit [Thermoprotei archaeon]|nr:MAG: fumarate reductase/succinate dehydrogenase flavoprotein subunit [Thermoprotei archaeon]